MLRAVHAFVAGLGLFVLGTTSAAAGDQYPITGTQMYSADCIDGPGASVQQTSSTVQADCTESLQASAAAPKPARGAAAAPKPVYLSCYYTKEVGFIPTIYTEPNGTPGGPLVRTCDPSPIPVDNSMVSAPEVTIPIFIPEPVPLTALVQKAYQKFQLAPPLLRMSPGVGHPQVVNVPTWYWLEPSSWTPVDSSVSLGLVTVTATATPVQTTWSSGDGASVTCAGPGTPYPSASIVDPPAESPSCGHTFTRASTDAPDGTFPLTAQISWRISWKASTGETGTLAPLSTAATTRVHVVEIQALVTGVRS